MIREAEVLLRIQHLEECAGRIAAELLPQLVHLIQNHHGVGNSAPLHALHDPAGHGSDIGPSVSADLCLIADTAQTDPDILPSQRLRNALADGGFSGTGGTHKQQDGTGLFLPETHDRQLLQDTLLHLLQAIMIRIKHFLCMGKIDLLCLRLLPGKRGYEIQIIIQHAVLMPVLPLLLHAVQNLIRLLPGGFIHAGLFDLFLELAHIGDILRMHFIQLILQDLDLLLQSVLPVNVLVFHLLLALCLIMHLGHLDELIGRLLDETVALRHPVLHNNGHLLLPGDAEVRRHAAHQLVDILPLQDQTPGPKAPLVHFHEVEIILLQAIEALGPFLRGQVLNVRTLHHLGVHQAVVVHGHTQDRHAALGADLQISVAVNGLQACGNTHRVDHLHQILRFVLILRHRTFKLRLVLQKDERDLVSHGHGLYLILLEGLFFKVKCDLGKQYCIMNRNSYHRIPRFLLLCVSTH